MVEPEQDFTPEEQLYRRIRKGDISPENEILPTAIDYPGCSCDRQKYRNDPRDVLIKGFSFVGSITVQDIPNQIVHSDNPETIVELYPWYCPTADNTAHSEIRLRRKGKEYSDRYKPSSKAFKLQIRNEIVSKMRLVVTHTS